jgi:hypothetical protein
MELFMCQAIKALSPITLPIRADPDPVGTELMGKAWNHAYPVDWSAVYFFKRIYRNSIRIYIQFIQSEGL